MFTGIVTDVGRVRSIIKSGDTRFEIRTSWDTTAIDVGASICCSGVCLTVVERDADWFAIDASAETLSCTILGDWREGSPVNLERSLRMGDELGGHLVSGHVDGVARIVSREPEGDSHRFVLAMPDDLIRFVAPKGSVALDGVSLTVNEVVGNQFGINIIPHTMAMTTFGEAAVGDGMNMEIDLLARYVAKQLEMVPHFAPGTGSGQGDDHTS